MICYLIRHGKDDDSVRGGWSNTPLSAQGIAEAEKLADALAEDSQIHIVRLFSSDLLRAGQTAEIIAAKLHLDVEYLAQFREVNNGVLAGMKNREAEEKYPGLFWKSLEWDACYPDGESPHQFYDRVSAAWHTFKKSVKDWNGNVILVTHGGVINVICHIENGLEYSNRSKPFSVKSAGMVSVEI